MLINRPVLGAIVASAIIAASCSSGHKELPVYNIAENLSTENNIDRLEASLILYPQVTDSTLIQSADYKGTVNGNHYISTGSLMAFDNDGKCLWSFNHRGNGPGEWNDAHFTCVNPSNGNWLVYEYLGVAKRYTSSGEYLGCDTLGKNSAIVQLADGILTANDAMTNKEIVLNYYNGDLQLIDSLNTGERHQVYDIPGGRASWNPTLLSCGNKVLYISHSDSVYNVSDPKKGAQLIGKVELGGFARPKSVDPSQPKRGFIHYSPLCTEDCLLVIFSFENLYNFRFYDLATGDLIANYSSDKEAGFGIPYEFEGHTIHLIPTYYSHGDRFYFYASDSDMAAITGNEDSNPAFFEVKIVK